MPLFVLALGTGTGVRSRHDQNSFKKGNFRNAGVDSKHAFKHQIKHRFKHEGADMTAYRFVTTAEDDTDLRVTLYPGERLGEAIGRLLGGQVQEFVLAYPQVHFDVYEVLWHRPGGDAEIETTIGAWR